MGERTTEIASGITEGGIASSHDVQFDSSFVTPDIASELAHLTRLRKRLSGARMSVASQSV
jgi:hypothetical protein